MEEKNRDKIIVRTSVIGIVTNVLLSLFKAAVGILSNSIAVTLDAVNNLSDALSSVITIIGTKLANKKPDKSHPLGHGRVEYISAMIVSAIVLYAGITSLNESIKKILHPATPSYTNTALLIIAVAVVVKIVLGRYVKSKGEQVNSGALTASGADAMFDAIISASVLGSALLFKYTGISVEAYVGVVIAIVIIKSGIDMLRETLSDIIGKRADPELTARVKEILTEEPEVMGAYDLILNNYGPDREYASAHIELPDTMTIDELDRLTRRLQLKVYQETGVIMTGIGVYSYNTSDDEAAAIRNDVQEMVMAHDWALQLHGFYADTVKKTIRFDVVMSFDVDHSEGKRIIIEEVKEKYPDYEVMVVSDIDISDI